MSGSSSPDFNASAPKDSRERLLGAARVVFARDGFDGATVKELADKAGVNVSLVSYYFGGKEGLYRACLDQFGRERLKSAERLLKAPESASDFEVRLRLFLQEFLECHVQDPEVTQILHRECDREMAGIQDLFKDVFMTFFERFAGFIEQGKAVGVVRADVDSKITSTLVFGGIIHFFRMEWAQAETFGTTIQDAGFRQAVLENTLSNLLNGVLAKAGPLGL